MRIRKNPDSIPFVDSRPTAYIAILIREDYKKVSAPQYEVGAAAATIASLASENKQGTSWIMSMNKDKIANLIKFASNALLGNTI